MNSSNAIRPAILRGFLSFPFRSFSLKNCGSAGGQSVIEEFCRKKATAITLR